MPAVTRVRFEIGICSLFYWRKHFCFALVHRHPLNIWLFSLSAPWCVQEVQVHTFHMKHVFGHLDVSGLCPSHTYLSSSKLRSHLNFCLTLLSLRMMMMIAFCQDFSTCGQSDIIMESWNEVLTFNALRSPKGEEVLIFDEGVLEIA